MSIDPIRLAMLRTTFVEGGLMMIGIAVGCGMEKMAQADPSFTIDCTWFGRVGLLLLALWLPMLWLLDFWERTAAKRGTTDSGVAID